VLDVATFLYITFGWSCPQAAREGSVPSELFGLVPRPVRNRSQNAIGFRTPDKQPSHELSRWNWRRSCQTSFQVYA